MTNDIASDVFNKEFRFEGESNAPDPFATPASFDANGVKHLKEIVKDADGKTLNTSSNNNPAPTAAEYADYMKPLEDILKGEFKTKDDSNRNYSAEAVKQFGNEFAHLNTRDQIYEQSLFNTTYKNLIKSDPNYGEYKAAIEGKVDMVEILKDVIAQKLRDDFNYSEETFNSRLEQFYKDGELTSEGKRFGEQMKSRYANALQQIEQNAKAEANKKVGDYKEYSSTLETEIDSFSPYGVELPDDFRAHIRELIKSGKSKEMPKTPQERAQREILEAIVSDPLSAAKFIAAIDSRGVTHGRNTAAKTNFMTSN